MIASSDFLIGPSAKSVGSLIPASPQLSTPIERETTQGARPNEDGIILLDVDDQAVLWQKDLLDGLDGGRAHRSRLAMTDPSARRTIGGGVGIELRV